MSVGCPWGGAAGLPPGPALVIAGLILAGGAGRRMGGCDKCLLPLAGRPILAWIMERLGPQVGTLALSANGDPARFAAFGLPVLADGAFAGLGPLAGLYAGLCWAAGQGADALLSVPGDTPFIPPDLAQGLAPGPAIAASNGIPYPVVGLWPVAAVDGLRQRLEQDWRHEVQGWARQIGARTVDFAAADDPFGNVNTPDELRQARARAGQIGQPGQS